MIKFKFLQQDGFAHKCLIYLNLMVPNGDFNDQSCGWIPYVYFLKDVCFFWFGYFHALLDIDQYGNEIVMRFVFGELRELVESKPVVAAFGDVETIIQGGKLCISGDRYAVFGLIISLVFVVFVQFDYPSTDPINPSHFQL